MKPEDKLRRLLHAADPEALSQYPMTDEATRRRIRDAVLGEAEPEQKPVTVHRISRIVNAAAVFLLIAGITGGSIAAIQTLRRNPLPPAGQYSSDSTSAAESSTDLPDQMTVYDRMLNAQDHYDRASGSCGMSSTAGTDEVWKYDFAVDIPAVKSRVLWSSGTMPENGDFDDLEAVETHDSFVTGGRKYICRHEQVYEADIGDYSRDEPLDAAAVRDCLLQAYENKTVPDTDLRLERNPVAGMNLFCLAPQFYAIRFLTDFDAWQITGEVEYIGRECLTIEGSITEFTEMLYSNTYDDLTGGSFTMYVDKETGCLLNYSAYTKDGVLSEWLSVKSIAFDEQAEAPVIPETDDPAQAQQTVYDRMQTGASGYCTRIWGRFVRCGANEAVDGSFDFSCTFSVDYANETAEGKCVGRRKTNTAEEILAGSEPVFQENSENGSEEITFPMTGSQNFCIHPSYYADLYLTDFTSWSVTGKADFIGRTCFIVEGTVPEGSIREDCIGGHFTMDVDEATGSLLRFALYDAEGTLCDWLCAQEIMVENADEPTPES